MELNREDILKKVEDGKDLSDEEELFYLTKILNHTEEEARRIIEINNNKDPHLLID